MIRSFRDKRTEALFEGETVAEFREIGSIALRKLDILDTVTRRADLRSPPGNRLEALEATVAISTASGSMTGGASASSGATAAPSSSRSLMIIKGAGS